MILELHFYSYFLFRCFQNAFLKSNKEKLDVLVISCTTHCNLREIKYYFDKEKSYIRLKHYN